MDRYLITGASRGIGRAVALQLAAKERHILLHGRDRAALEETRKGVEAKGAEASVLVYDLAESSQVERMTDAVGGEPIQVLVNSAGIAVVKPVRELALDEWQRTLDVNVTAPFLITQKLLPRMPEGASVVNILSVAAKVGFADWSSYCMSKFALEGFMLSLREEIRSRGIRVINVYPAASDTALWNDIQGTWPREKMMRVEETAEAVAFALSRPKSVVVENITLGNLGGNL
jgi:short-subunit dehydrogenase